jgi:prepilin-type N-terminal cleavage/methylation domain-containing protein
MVSIAINTNRSRQAFTLVELMVAILVGSLAMMALMSVMFFSARSFAALTNYVDLDNHSRSALDVMTREIRQANSLVEGDPQRLVFSVPRDDGTAYTVTYQYDSRARQLTRQTASEEKVLLRECDQLRFAVYQRHPISGTYDQWDEDWSNPSQVKVVQLMWTCSREILGARVNTESVQSAKVVIRKK